MTILSFSSSDQRRRRPVSTISSRSIRSLCLWTSICTVFYSLTLLARRPPSDAYPACPSRTQGSSSGKAQTVRTWQANPLPAERSPARLPSGAVRSQTMPNGPGAIPTRRAANARKRRVAPRTARHSSAGGINGQAQPRRPPSLARRRAGADRRSQDHRSGRAVALELGPHSYRSRRLTMAAPAYAFTISQSR